MISRGWRSFWAQLRAPRVGCATAGFSISRHPGCVSAQTARSVSSFLPVVMVFGLLFACSGREFQPEEVRVKTVNSFAELSASHGQRVWVEGVVSRAEMSIGPGQPWRATALILDDGVLVWVDYAEQPPPGWADLEGRRVGVEALVWRSIPPSMTSGVGAPHITEWGEPKAIGPLDP